jgi:hypothetical protein
MNFNEFYCYNNEGVEYDYIKSMYGAIEGLPRSIGGKLQYSLTISNIEHEELKGFNT